MGYRYVERLQYNGATEKLGIRIISYIHDQRGLKPSLPASEYFKNILAFDHSAVVIGIVIIIIIIIIIIA
jgi:hypothetical protein